MVHLQKSSIPEIQKDLAFIHGDNSEEAVFHLLQILTSYPKTFLRVKASISRTRYFIERERECRKVASTDYTRTYCEHFDRDSGSCSKYESGCFHCPDFPVPAPKPVGIQ